MNVWIDPTHEAALPQLLGLEQLARDAGADELDLRLWLHPPDLALRRVPPARLRLHALAQLAVERGGLPGLRAALVLLARGGLDEVGAALADPALRRAVAVQLGLDPAELDAAVAAAGSARPHPSVDDASLHRDARRRLASSGRPMLARLQDGTWVDPGDRRLVTAIEQRRRDAARDERRRPSAPPRPAARGRSDELRRVALHAGARLGGPGLPHEAVLFVRGEDDPLLFAALPLLCCRSSDRVDAPSADPTRVAWARVATVAVHVIARGSDPEADRLRRRLCGARLTGLEGPYLRLLARDPSERDGAAAADLLRELDARGRAPACAADAAAPLPSDDIPGGPWIDGIPYGRVELEQLAQRLALDARLESPLDPFLLE